MREQALALVAAVQASPGGARRHYLDMLPPPLLAEYEAAERLAMPDGLSVAVFEGATADSLDERLPLPLPVVLNGRLYVASVGHDLIFQMAIANWSVAFDTVENGKLVRQATIPIETSRGRVTDVVITPN
jgi:hypothetical protein